MNMRKDETDRRAKERQNEDTTEYDNFQRMLDQVLSVPKEELDKRRVEYQRERKEKWVG